MTSRKISLLFLSLLLFCGSLALLFYQGKGEAFSPPQSKIKVMRGRDKTRQGPTTTEAAAFRNVSRKELTKGQDQASPQGKPKRQLDNLIPKHVPIKIKIKKEKEKDFQERDDEHWVRNFELEVTNTGNRPIYYLCLVYNLPEIKAPNGDNYGTSFSYGRSDLVAFSEPLKPDDVPFKPGETIYFKLSEMSMAGWEGFSQEENKGKPQPLHVEIILDTVNFGDGTGYRGPAGTPRKVLQRPGRSPSSFGGNANSSETRWRFVGLNYSCEFESVSDLPAKVLLANFFRADRNDHLSVESSSRFDIPCGSSCSLIKEYQSRCYCSDITKPNVNDMTFTTSADSTDANAECGNSRSQTDRCPFPGLAFPLFCTQSFIVPCGSESESPTPTPSPTPSPSPSPSPSCPQNTKPNEVNCKCVYVMGGETGWDCSCPEGSFYADNKNFQANYGCPGNSSYSTNGCCTCVQTDHTCPEGCTWVDALCGCYSATGPCSTIPVMQPGSGTGGGEGHEPGDAIESCNNYYWV